VPQEPAGWANLGLLLLRQQEIGPAKERLAKAAELAPDSPAIARLLAIAESKGGNPAESIRHWRRALDLDPADTKAAYALALEIERQGGADQDAEAQRVLEDLLKRSDNLPARLDAMRLAAKRGDAAALTRGLDALGPLAAGWPEMAQTRLQAVRAAAAANPRSAATQVVFLKNVLVREPAYRRALALVSTPLDAVGEPLERFLVLANPPSGAARPDAALSFTATPVAGGSAETVWAGAIVPAADAKPLVADGGRGSVRLGGMTLPVPASMAATLGPDAVAAVDLNYDFRTDLVIASGAGLVFLRQGADGRFTDVSRETKLPPDVLTTAGRAVWPADADTDGDLDLVFAPSAAQVVRLLRNNGDGTFTVQEPFPGVTHVLGFAWADFDGEGVPDAAFLDGAGRVHVFLNLRGGAFQEDTLPATSVVTAMAAMEATGDERCDLVLLEADGQLASLSRGDRGGWTRTPIGRFEAAIGRDRLVVADLDNNGAADIVIPGANSSLLLLAAGPGTLAPAAVPTIPTDVRAAADLDDDGRLELVGVASGRAVTLKSTGQTAYHWQTLRPKAATATGDQRINSFGIGGTVEVRSGLHVQRTRIESPIVHIGLGEARAAEVIRIGWPNGVLQSEFDREAGTTIAASQRLKGSCPWLFAWNGHEMAFVTDLIWRSPLGLRINAQATADVLATGDWVRLRGDQLLPRDGAYELRVTAELWETHFFDLLSLLVVDHPIDTEVWVDERFTIPPPALRPIVTGPMQALAAARDDRGHDVSEVVAARDDRHADFAGRGAWQGITRPHFIELELPETAPRQGPLWLIAQGWVHPTDSSVNVAISQGANAAPQGLALEATRADGSFRPVRGGLGFPSGKDKTILIDLAGVFEAHGPRRLRLSTNLEIFWDRIGWAVGRPDVRVEPQALAATAADLRYRGFSVTTQRASSSPERPSYTLAGTAPRWRDLEGYHTRFGDVRELLAAVDDRYVIMNAGDEIALRFPALADPGAGTRRDFILAGDGWVKDGDFNTTFSRTVLPLPTHATGRYATPPRALEDDPVYQRHRADFETWHTRYVAPDRLTGALSTTGPAER